MVEIPYRSFRTTWIRFLDSWRWAW